MTSSARRLRARALRLPKRNAGACQQSQRDNDAGRDLEPVAADELAGPVTQSIGLREDRLVIQMTTQVLRQGFDGRVALGAVLLQRLVQDRVEVAALSCLRSARLAATLLAGGASIDMMASSSSAALPRLNRYGRAPVSSS